MKNVEAFHIFDLSKCLFTICEVKIMKKKEAKWYVVKKASRKYSAHIFRDFKQCSAFMKSAKLTYKAFDTKEDAIAHAGCKESKIYFHVEPTKKLPEKICLVCEKPFKGKTKLCPTCNKLRGDMSVTTATILKAAFPDEDIFKLRDENPHVISMIYRQTTRDDRAAMKTGRKSTLYSAEYKSSQYQKNGSHIPDYIVRIFEQDKTKELSYLEGDKLNPYIYYVCKKCGLEQCQQYEKLKVKAGHNCDAEKSSGEVIVEEYLKKHGIPYKVQFETLSCINPKTKKQMPYDFELFSHQIIIEVQGNQHLEYIPHFHGSEENFQYQLWKDTYKKDFAERKGYDVLYITYQDIRTGRYEQMIRKLVIKKQKALNNLL